MIDRFRRLAVVSFCASLMLIDTTGFAAETPAASAETPIAAPTPVTAAEISGWVRDLESNSFRTRRTAMRMLLKAGSQVVAAVAIAAETDDLELASRCIDILKTLHQSENTAAKSTAEEALKRLSKSGRASVAQRATDAVKKPAPTVPNVGFGRVQFQFRIGPLRNRPIRVGPAGGIQIGGILRREIKVEENGKKISIKEMMGRGIVVTITEKVDGKDKTTEYKSKSFAALKRQHPEACKLYLKHMRGAGAPKFQPAVVPLPAGVQGRNITIRQTNNNGNRVTDVEIDGKKIHITDSRGKNIVVKVAEKIGGKMKTSEYNAKDLAELKKEHPEGAKLYEQYAAGQNNVGAGIFQGRIQFNGGAAQLLPIRAIPFPGGNPAQRIAAQKQIAVAQQRLNQAVKQLKELAAKGNAKPDDLTKMAKEIEAAIQQLQAAQKQLAR
jgi:hypothetical protein